MLESADPPDAIDMNAACAGLLGPDARPDARFDAIARIAQALFKAQMAFVALVACDSERLDASVVVETGEIGGPGPAGTGGAAGASHPPLAEAPRLRQYALIAIMDRRGRRAGTLCLLNDVPWVFAASDLVVVRDLARLAQDILAAPAALRDGANDGRLQAIVEHAGDAIVTIDDQGIVEIFNPAAQRIFGYQPQEIIGQPVTQLVARHFRATLAHAIDDVGRNGLDSRAPVNRQVFAERRDGARFPANLVVSEMRIGGRRAFACLVRDISQRRRSAGEAMRKNRKLVETLCLQQAIFDSTDYAIIAVNASGQVTMFNDGATRMLGYTEGEMRTQDALVRLHDPAELAERAAAMSLELGRPVRVGPEIFIAKAREGMRDEREWTYIRKDGSRVPVMLSIAPVWDEQHALAGLVGIAQDRSEQKKTEQLKNEFISTLSHELRTPLTSIRGSLGLLSGGAAGQIPAGAKALLDIAVTNCDRVVRLINEILDVDKIVAGSLIFDTRIQPLLPLVEQALTASVSHAAKFQVGYALRCDDGAMAAAVDAVRLRQAIVNLLSNAAQFSSAGDVVQVHLQRIDDMARLSVIDHGIGITPEFHARVFQKFAQADATDSRKIGGAGLGLSIAKAIIEQHHGALAFHSAPGVRTEFYFDLPLAVPA